MSNVNALLDGFVSALTLTNLGFGLLGTLLGTNEVLDHSLCNIQPRIGLLEILLLKNYWDE
jgi:TctA family transporter